MNLLDELKHRIIFFDGGTGTLLQQNGLMPGELPELWNKSHPDIITRLHLDYLKAGADIIKTNTFGANALKFHGKDIPTVHEIVSLALSHAKKARELYLQSNPGSKEKYIALDLGPTGKLLKPLGDLSFDRAVDLYREVVEAGANAGADLILIETMSDTYEAKAAVLAAKEASHLPVFLTVTVDGSGKLLTGASIQNVCALAEGLRVDALGLNCGLGPVQMRPLFEELKKYSSLPIILNPNAGLPSSHNGQVSYDIGPEEFASYMEEFAKAGAGILGGCCGTTPDHIHRVYERCSHLAPLPVIPKDITMVSSYSRTVVIDSIPVLIGERINPTGKKKLKEALKSHDIEYILEEGLSQQDMGAHVLDVNVGLPDIDEAAMLEETVEELQAVTNLPLQIDTSNPAAMERALRIYNGKAMINSVNGKEEVMREVFPLVQKYGGVLVALTLDESGIPDTSDGRIAIAKKIYDTAALYGIPKKDILVDCLAMTVSSDPNSALVTLDTLRRVKEELHGKTILGVSNVSFGLPARPVITGCFFALAMERGLNAAIVNPLSKEIQDAYHSFLALHNLDPNCQAYISRFKDWKSTASSPQESSSREETNTPPAGSGLTQAIIKGMKEAASLETQKLLKEGRQPLEIINQLLVPALDQVGQGFEKQTLFLPQLLMSAEAAKASFDVIKSSAFASGKEQKPKGTIVLATVKGDIHDIGKNIVKVLLENYSYQVVDLGKDVPAEAIVEAVVKTKAPLAGLSALMTTTVPSMEETIRLLHREAPWCRVMVGGAVLTQEYADQIGADFYGKDAMASVHYAESIFH